MGLELIRWRYSTTAALTGNSVPRPSPSASLGLYVSRTDWTGSASGNLFDPQPADDEVADHRCVFVVNLNSIMTLVDASVHLGSLPSGSNIEIGLDPLGTSAVDSVEPQASVLALETDPLPGVKFSTPTTPQTAISLGLLGPRTARAIWIRRTPVAGAAASPSESFTVRLSGTLTP